MNKSLWGEDKLIAEEALAAGLIGAASATALLAPFINSMTMQNIMSGSFHFPELLTVSAIAAATASAVGIVGWQKSEWLYDGMTFVDDPEVGRIVMQENERKLMTKAQKAGKVKGLIIGGVELSRTREVAHAGLNGLPGGGKTVIINNIIKQIFDRPNEKLVIHDPKGDFTSFLYNKDDTVIAGPWDNDAIGWDLSADLTTPGFIDAFANILATAGIDKSSTSGASNYFLKATEGLIAGYLKYCLRHMGDNWAIDTLAHELMVNGKWVDKALLGDPQLKALIGSGKGEQIQNVISSFSTAVSWIPAYAASFKIVRDSEGNIDREASNLFSIRKWLTGEDHLNVKKFILNNNANFQSQATLIFGAMLSVMRGCVNGSDMPSKSSDSEGGIWFIIDELPQLGGSVGESIAKIEEMGRSKGVRVLKAFQDESQIVAQLGKDKGRASMSVQQTKVYLKCAPETASEVARGMGRKTIIRAEPPWINGASGKKITKIETDVINQSDLTGLKVLEHGVELIVRTDDVLVKLVQPFVDSEFTAEVRPQFIENELFERGILDLAEKAEIEEMLKKGIAVEVMDKTKVEHHDAELDDEFYELMANSAAVAEPDGLTDLPANQQGDEPIEQSNVDPNAFAENEINAVPADEIDTKKIDKLVFEMLAKEPVNEDDE